MIGDYGAPERKYHRPETGLTVTDGRVVAGYASLFGVKDQGGDVVAQGAYAASLVRLGKTGARVRMLWQHDPGAVIGVWDEVREDATGLWVKGRLLEAVEKGREAAALMAAGAVDGLSIGYRTRRAEKLADGGRRLLELELWEVSLVTFPMLPAARLAGKGEGTADDLARVFAEGLEAARAVLRD